MRTLVEEKIGCAGSPTLMGLPYTLDDFHTLVRFECTRRALRLGHSLPRRLVRSSPPDATQLFVPMTMSW